MTKFIKAATEFVRKKEEAASIVEYALLVGLIAVVCLAAITLLGQNISSLLSQLAVRLTGIAP